jgi:hypothetical protein
MPREFQSQIFFVHHLTPPSPPPFRSYPTDEKEFEFDFLIRTRRQKDEAHI